MASIEPWQTGEIPGPKKAAVISKPEVIDALLKRSKRPILVVGHLAAGVKAGDKAMVDYLLELGKARDVPIIATGDTNRALLSRGYAQATIMPAVDIGQRLTDPGWKGLDGKGAYDLAMFAGLPYYMEWTILSGLKHLAPHVKTVTLDNKYQPNANFSFANIPTGDWVKHINAVIGQREG
jgi:anaerobic carbon-monoxide dehydrogenase, CODH/ACS complex subunit epsilon